MPWRTLSILGPSTGRSALTAKLIVTGACAGLALGFVLQRADLCFHSTWRGLFEHRYGLFKVWILGVAIASVGLSLIYATGWWDLNEGLAFDPFRNVLGGLVIGIGMVIAASCTSGLFYKLGSGMLGALAGIAGWFAGELVVRNWDLPGETVLDSGPDGTIPGWLGVPRLAVAIPFLLVVVLVLARTRRDDLDGRWNWIVAGVALGDATILAWALAGIGGHRFGPSTVGFPSTIADWVTDGTTPRWWLVAFLLAVVPGATIAARSTRSLWLRGERPVRYVGLAAGGLLLGAGGRIGGGCNLGHGLSGVAQMNVGSWVTVAAIVAGIGIARAVQRLLASRGVARLSPAEWRARTRTATT